MGATARLPRRCRDTARHEATSPAPRPRRPARSRACGNSGQAVRGDDARHCYRTRLSTLLIAGWPPQLISAESKSACAERPRVVIEAIPASNDVNLPGLATTETLTRHVNLNYFSEAVSWEGEERLADVDSWRITGNSDLTGFGKSCRRSVQGRTCRFPTAKVSPEFHLAITLILLRIDNTPTKNPAATKRSQYVRLNPCTSK